MQWIAQFFGRFHPLLVHFPIGILFLAFLFECLSHFKKYNHLRSSIGPTLLLGALASVAAVVSGLFLSEEGGYDDQLLERHKYLGIATASFTILLYVLHLKSVRYFQKTEKPIRIILFLTLIVLLSYTGHYGGSLTHGEDFIFEFISPAEEPADPAAKLQAITNIDSAVLYAQIIQPILEARCYSCHSSRKQKGDLRLDGMTFINHGGKNGPVIELNLPDSSSLYQRLTLPLEDEDHMPPNEKPQPSSTEVALIQTWIEEGASFDKKVAAYRYADKVRGYFQLLLAQSKKEILIPTKEVSAAEPSALDELKAKGIIALPAATETNYLYVSFINHRTVSVEDMNLLLPLRKQLIWLNLSRTTITDESMQVIPQLSELIKLNLDHTAITDVGIQQLATLTQLTHLNLVGTKITDKGLMHLKTLKNLKNIFIYQTEISAQGIQEFALASPGIKIDTGGYQLPKLSTDTIIFKKKPV